MNEPDVVAHQVNGNGTNGVRADVWKWVAMVLAAILLAGAPGYIYLYLNSPRRTEFAHVSETQQLVLQRLVALELSDTQSTADILDLRTKLEALRLRQEGGR